MVFYIRNTGETYLYISTILMKKIAATKSYFLSSLHIAKQFNV